MNKTKIEWTDYTWNPVKGICPYKCFYCYARKFYKRFGWDKKVRIDFKETQKLFFKKGRIFVCSTIDLFHPSISSRWIQMIIQNTGYTYYLDNNIFLFLTKNPQRYREFNFPKNCWLGLTLTGKEDDQSFLRWQLRHKHDNIKYISFEPLLKRPSDWTLACGMKQVQWIIIGAMTGYGKKYQPNPEWIKILIRFADRNNVPVFMKNNLSKVWKGKLRQEFPNAL